MGMQTHTHVRGVMGGCLCLFDQNHVVAQREALLLPCLGWNLDTTLA